MIKIITEKPVFNKESAFKEKPKFKRTPQRPCEFGQMFKIEQEKLASKENPTLK